MKINNVEELLKTISVLYVEDDEQTAQAMAKYIQKRVKSLYVTNNGEYGLDLFQSKKIDLIITDIKMPYMNGIDMVKAIKKIKKDVKVIFISAYHEDDLFLKAIEVGADGFLTKPVSAANGLLPLMHKATIEIVKDRMLSEYTKTLKLILDYVDSMVVVTDGEKVFNANHSFLKFFGCNEFKQFSQKYPELHQIFTQSKEYISGKDWLSNALNSTPAKVKIKENIFLIQPKAIESAAFNPKYVVNFTDITQLEDEQEKLMHNASKDVVTHLINRDIFEKIYEKELQYTTQTKIEFSIISIKLRNLEAINLQSSLAQGDTILLELATLIGQHFQKSDAITRWGGGNFLVLFPSKDEKTIGRYLENFNQAVKVHPFKIEQEVELRLKYKKVQSNIKLENILEEFKNDTN